MRLQDVAARALHDSGLKAFPQGSESYLWRVRVSSDLWDEAVAEWGWHDDPGRLHDAETRLFGYFAVRDTSTDGEVEFERMPEPPGVSPGASRT
jgi:hypothetical protein